ncbi:hypothetical protein HGI47_04170 [Novosphingobium sp. ERN07]|uniref:hypothetical protein n=1 Tax=Novosphingobium sp. ERN07 TaxID=2726187 RepID=UPI001456D733|nr:hypothetical protein [Novosphingobium sp. ERN07]NLR70068.1 hypothetical protein [Novosphingobium sp. ERN07]
MRTIPSATVKQLVSASGLALATALVAMGPKLMAQGFNASGTVVAGTATINTTPTTTAITVFTPSAVINWTPNDTAPTGGPINFQDSIATTTYQNDFSISNYAVLNRIIPVNSTRPIQFNGTVISQLQAVSAPPTPGGTLFFYSPGGILVGGSSVFNVGSLTLTTSDLAYDATGVFDTSGSYVFQPATVAGSQIVVSAGAQLNASVDGSYIAMVAPSITNNGTINVNGSAALVAADAATITFSPSGLFDVQVDSGTSATGTVIQNSGSITGAAASQPNFVHRVYMVAVPKNDAITMAIGAGSSLGFDIAGAADAIGNAIILSAGQDIVGGDLVTTPSAGGGTGVASITAEDSTFSSAFTGRATGAINMVANSASGILFAGSAVLRAKAPNSSVTANAGSVVNFADTLRFSARDDGTATDLDAQAGGVALRALDGGAINVAGNATLIAEAFGAASTVAGTVSGNGFGGTVLVEAVNGGTISFQSDVDVFADGVGGEPTLSGIGGGVGTGGSVVIRASGTTGSAIDVGGDLTIISRGEGTDGTGCTNCVFEGGSAFGGSISLFALGSGNSLSLAANTSLDAGSDAGEALTGSVGDAAGGTITVRANDGANISFVDFSGLVSAGGGWSDGIAAGNATGGTIEISTSGTGAGGISVEGGLTARAEAFGGLGQSLSTAGGAATGGAILVSSRDEKVIGVTGDVNLSSNATGGDGYAGSMAGTGGSVTIETATAGFLVLEGSAALTAQGFGGLGLGTQVGGVGTGGVTTIQANGGLLTVTGDAFLNSNGNGGSQLENAMAGAGQGGTAEVRIGSSGNIELQSSLELLAFGNGGSAGSGPDTIGGNGTGGIARLDLGGGSLSVTGDLRLDSAGVGGGGAAQGGDGLGGQTSIFQFANTLDVEGTSYIGADGGGGSAFFGSTGGSGAGGTITINANQSTTNLSTADNATLEATGFGADGRNSGTGTGGTINITATAGTISAGNELQVFAEGQGGDGGLNGGDGALGTGGTIRLFALGDVHGASSITAPTLNISATGRGGNGTSEASAAAIQAGDGGAGLGGAVSLVTAPDGGTIQTLQLTVQAAGAGGLGGDGGGSTDPGENGGSGGNATGGNISFRSVLGTGSAAGGFLLGDAIVNAGATGGLGGTGASSTNPGLSGSGGNAQGGLIDMQFDAGGSLLQVDGLLSVQADGVGANTGNCFNACTATAGSGTGGTIIFGSNGMTSGNQINLSTLQLSAFGRGGNSDSANGGLGQGGSVFLRLNSGLALTADTVALDAYAEGGDAISSQTGGLIGGFAFGGNAQFTASGTSSAVIGSGLSISTSADGGRSSNSGTGGNGTGGTSRLYSDGGVIEITGNVLLDAAGNGGNGISDDPSGGGGAGRGGNALLTVGTPTLLGNNGRIVVVGQVVAFSDANGGSGFNPGSGTGGLTAIVARQGTLELDQVFVSSNAAGGNGLNGGIGGIGKAGTIEIFAHSAVEGGSLLLANNLTAQASATGGEGGNVFDPDALGAVGGVAEGGNISIFGSAGNGNIDIETIDVSADAIGGTGGSAVFDLGGVGGLGTGGAVQLGVSSGLDTGTTNTGSARFGTVTASASGFGGTGGSAEFVGGDGGTGIGGGVSLIVRGGPVTIDNPSTFDANAGGGNGGSATAAAGNGGNAVISNQPGATIITGVKLVVTNRFNQPTQRGNLTANGLSFTAAATAGTGTVSGTTSMAQSALRIEVTNSSYTGTDLSMVAIADNVGTNIQPDTLSMSDGSLIDLSGSLGISTPGTFLLRLDASDAVADSVAISAANWTLGETTPATLGNLIGTTSLALNSGLDLVGHANLQSDGAITLSALGDIQFGDVLSLGSIGATADGSITLANLSSQGSVDLFGLSGIQTGLISSIGSVSLASAGTVITDEVVAGSGTASASGSSIAIDAGVNISTGNLISNADVTLLAGGDIGTGLISAYDALALGHGSVALGGVELVNRLLVADIATGTGSGRPTKEQIFAATPIATAGGVSIFAPSTAVSLLVVAGTTVDLSDFTAPGQISVLSGGNATFGNLSSSAAAIDLVSTGGGLTAGNISAALGLSARSGGAMQLGTVAGSLVTLASGLGLTTGNTTAASGGIKLSANGDMQTGSLTSAGDVFATTPGNIATGAVGAVDALLLGGGNVAVDNLIVSNRALIANASMAQPSGQGGGQGGPAQPGTPPTKEQILAATPIATGGSVALANASNVGSLRIAAGTAVNTANVIASSNIGVTSGGNGTFGTLLSSDGNVELLSRAGSLTGSTVNARFDVLASGATGLNLDRAVGRDLALLSGGDVSIGEARAGAIINSATGQVTGATGQLLIANTSMLAATAMPGAINYATLLAKSPVASGGAVLNTRNAIAGRISITSTGAVNSAELAGYESIGVTSDGRVTVAERWTSPLIRILGTDISIVDNGVGGRAIGQQLLSGIRTTQDGTVDIISTSGSPALIGDGLTGSGFALSNNEIGLISTNRLTIAAVDITGNPIDMLIGKVDLTAGGNIGVNTLAGSTGRLIFATGNAASQALGGTIRVTGAINGTGFGSGNVLEFSTGRFELDAATGSISLASTGTTLGGIAEFNAVNIHVASATILDKLAANPFYTGRIADLNAPATVQRPEGVLRALGLDFHPTGTLYIQNTGTALNPAGFFADIDFADVTAPTGAQPGSISVVVNGAFQTPTGIVSGIDAHDLAVDGADDLSIFSADSQINGCLFSAEQCASPLSEGPDVIGAIAGQFEIVTQDPLGSTPGFAEEPSDEEGDPEDEAEVQIQPSESGPASPIVPPTPIINDSPLDTTSQIDEPVTGSGNPALIGTNATTTVQAGDAQ